MFSYLKDNDYILNEEKISLTERNFRIAFTIEDTNEDYSGRIKLKNDERYVKWLFRIVGKREGLPF